MLALGMLMRTAQPDTNHLLMLEGFETCTVEYSTHVVRRTAQPAD